MPKKTTKESSNTFSPKSITPLTNNQKAVFNTFEKYHMLLHGYAGTGKTYISLYLGLNEILTSKPAYDNIIIVRSVVQSRDMGFLPGSVSEKSEMYENPYSEIVNDLFERGDAYDILKKKGVIKFCTTSFLRGLTFNRSIVIVDEIQNMSFQELDTIITRVGHDTKIVFCGDFRQTDLVNENEKRGLKKFMDIITDLKDFVHVEFAEDDIVRSGLVKEYIIRKHELEN